MPKDTPRPTQVLLTVKDRHVTEELLGRAAALRRRVSGPTGLYRAGLIALREADDATFCRWLRVVDERPSDEELLDLFRQWCSWVAAEVVSRGGGDLAYAYEGDRHPERVGNFQHQARFAHVALMNDGRVLISGMEADPRPLAPGERVRMATVMFPGGLATLLSPNEEGAQLAASAIVAFLLRDEDALQHARELIGRHHAEPVR